MLTMNNDANNIESEFDHGTHQEFVDYYAKESLSEAGINRMKGIFNCIHRNLSKHQREKTLDIADIGCGPGLLSMMWANEGHRVHGIDVNEALIELAKTRANDHNLNIEFILGSATNLPWPDESMDICIAPELLEHIADWEKCIIEFIRILKPEGILYISTANKLCPKQQEFNLPLYSWYPGLLKRYFEKLAKTTHPEIAGYATYPAVNWFSYYQLRKVFSQMGMETLDRFDIMDIDNKPQYQQRIVKLIKHIPFLRWLGHVATPGLTVLAIKKS